VTSAEDELPPGGIELTDPPFEPWSPLEVTERLAEVAIRWCVAGGWALDLYAGGITREHEDLEIAVPAASFGFVRDALADFEFDVVGSGYVWPLDSAAFAVMHQTWVREPVTGIYRLDVFREPHDGDTWICRRDETIRLPYNQVIDTTADGVPFMAPEIVLLFKAKHCRPKDQADFGGTLDLLGRAQRAWLADTLARVHPGHEWLQLL
jgi:hypothetical protein